MASIRHTEVSASLIDAINGLPDAIFLVAESGVIVAVNTAAETTFGSALSRLVGSRFDDLIPAGARDYHREARAAVANDVMPRQFTSGRTFECERRGGESFRADMMLSPTVVDGVPMTWATVRDLDSPSEINAGRQQALGALDAIGHMAACTFDLSQNFSLVAERLKDVIPHDRIGVTLVCEDDPNMIEIAFLAGDDHSSFEQGDRLPISISATARVVDTRSRVTFKRGEPGMLPTAIQASFKQGYTELCGAPLLDGASVIGMLLLSTRGARGFSEFQKNLIERLARHLGVCVVNQRIRGKLQARSGEIESIGEIGKKISSSADLASALSAASEPIRKLVSYARLAIYNIDLESGVVSRIVSAGDQLPGAENLAHTLPGDTTESFKKMFAAVEPVVFDRKGIVAITDSLPLFDSHRNPDYRRALVVPLQVTRRPVGIMVFLRSADTAFSAPEIAIATRIGEQLAGPVANSFQLDRANDEARTESVLAEISTIVDSKFDLQASQQELGSLIRKLVDNNSITIASITPDGQNLRLVYMGNAGTQGAEGWSIGGVQPWKGTTAEQVLHTRGPVVVNAENWDKFRERFPGSLPGRFRPGLRSVINVPLVTNDEIFGFLTLRSVKRNAYFGPDVAMAVRIAAQLTGTVALSELRRRDADLANERAALLSIGGLLGSAVELGDVWAEFAEQLSRLLPLDHVSLTGIDRNPGLIRVLNDSWTNGGTTADRTPGEPFPLSGSIVEGLASADQGVIFTAQDLQEWAQLDRSTYSGPPLQPLRSLIGVPLVWGGEVVAALFIHSTKPDAYSPADLRLVERVAAQIAGPMAGGIARQQQAELALERQRREAAELKAAVLAELNETKSNFVSAMSHELKTPLTSIVAFSDILSRQGEKVLGERPLKHMKVIQRNARRLEGMIDELLDLSRMESGRFEIVRSTFDFVSMVTESLENSEPLFEEMSQIVQIEIAADVLPVNGDRGRLLQVVNNLLSNASKYSPNDSDIEVGVDETDGVLTVEVSDRGPGTLGENPEELFEMFHRANDEATLGVPGTGIGLHVAKRIVEEHGGEIVIESREGGGATARFWIPTGVEALI